MRFWQPNVQRHNSCLNSEAKQKKKKCHIPILWGQLISQAAKRFELVALSALKQQQETQNQASGPDVRHDEIKYPCIACLGFLMLKADEAIGG